MKYFPHKPERARNSKPGWKKFQGDDTAIFSPAYGIVVHADVGTDEKAAFDQILRLEKSGSVFLPVAKAKAERSGRANNGKIWFSDGFINIFGLQKVMRPQAVDRYEFNRQINELFEEVAEKFDGDETEMAKMLSERLQRICALLGRESLEIPRGFAKLDQTAEARAIDEFLQSTGHAVTQIELLGIMNDNNAHVGHMTEVFFGIIDRAADPNQDGRLDTRQKKTLSGLQWYTRQQLDGLIGEGKVYDGYTLSALQMYEAAARAERFKADPEANLERIFDESE